MAVRRGRGLRGREVPASYVLPMDELMDLSDVFRQALLAVRVQIPPAASRSRPARTRLATWRCRGSGRGFGDRK